MFSDSIDTIKIFLIDGRFDGHGNGNDSWNKTSWTKGINWETAKKPRPLTEHFRAILRCCRVIKSLFKGHVSWAHARIGRWASVLSLDNESMPRGERTSYTSLAGAR